MSDATIPRYNLFAAVLQDMIAASPLNDPDAPPRGARLDDLTRLGAVDDFRGIDDRLHPETVRRLKRSLVVAGQFPVLSKVDMRKVARTFQLSSDEQRRLRAALLATGIEAKLEPRIGIERAVQAAASLLPIIEDGLKQLENNEASGIPYIRAGQEGADMSDETELERHFSSALTAIDHAMLALGMLERVESQIERADCARQARDHFAFALSKLEMADEALRALPAWEFWHRAASEGLAEAEKLLGKKGSPS
jgi:hypothetical protein